MLEERESSFPLKSPILLYLKWYMQMCMIAYAVSHLKAINMQVLFFSNESVEQQTSRQFACFLQIYELNVTAVINHISMDQMLSTWMGFTAHTTSGPITLAYNISCRKFIQMQLELHLIIFRDVEYLEFYPPETLHPHLRLFRDITCFDVSP